MQISDIHLYADKNATLLNLKTSESFSTVLALAKKKLSQQKTDLIVMTGDLSQDDSLQSYQHLLDSMKDISCEIAWIPGNHDNIPVMRQLLGTSYFNPNKYFILNDWQIILLDSHHDGKVSGYLKEDQLNFLETRLSSCPNHTLIMLHHHVLPVGSVWLDKINLENSDQFLRIIDNFQHIKGVICGHVHQVSQQARDGVQFISAPSTSIQFKPLSDDFALDTVMPGFNVIELHEDGRIEHTIHRIPFDSIYVPDLTSKGY